MKSDIGDGGILWRRKAGCFCDRHTAHRRDWLIQNLFTVFRFHKQMLLYCLVHKVNQGSILTRRSICWKAEYCGEQSGLLSVSPRNLPGTVCAVPCGREGNTEPPFLSAAESIHD